MELQDVRSARPASWRHLQPLPHRPQPVLGADGEGDLSILPQREGHGYGVGYGGGGSHALAAYLTQLAETDGQNTAVGTSYSREDPHPAILNWTQSSAADRGTNELSLSDLKAMVHS
ncbi:hypothetical protein [Streptomyces rimosus]|uniref:hypothetical protein n=1 Tax=Streptomyces rimosus TaxID=1927 RepID=UPI000AFA878D|nr:hypothetical protein [Streptomyces rimosus]